MEANQFILALSKTLPQSCVQGLVIYLLLQLLFWVDKRSTPLLKFNLYYAASWLLLASFLFTFFHHFRQDLPFKLIADSGSTASAKQLLITSIKPVLRLSARFWLQHYTYLITGFYLLGLLFFLLRFAVSIFKVEQFRNPGNLKLDYKLSELCIRLSNNFGLIKTVSVYLSAKITVPLTIGFIKPIIVFPVALINQLSTEQTEAILLHELSHIKRNDYMLNLLLCVVQAFLFFNPAVWLMQREISKYREQSCDDLVLEQTQHKLAYAHALLLIEQHRNQNLNLILTSNGKKYTLLNRIERITNMRTNESSPKSKLVVLLFALITIGVCVACNHTRKKEVKPYKLKRLLYTIYHTKSTGFNPTKPYVEWSTDTTKFIRKSEHDTLKAYTNEITYIPNKKHNKRYIFSGNNLMVNEFYNTPIHSKTKYKIIVEDSLGNKKEYNSIDELPEADRKEFTKESKKTNKLKEVSISLKFSDSTKYTYHGKYADSLDLKIQTKEMFSLAKKQIADYKNRTILLELKNQEKNRKRLIDSARKNWKNASDYQMLPASTPIIINPEK